MRSNGSIVNLRYEVSDSYEYTAPDGAVYWHSTLYDDNDPAGRARFDEIDEWIPHASHHDTNTRILINLTKKTYSENVYRDRTAPDEGPTPNLLSSPSQVRKSLRGGRVTEKGTATINGRSAITLAVALPTRLSAPSETLTLYVDARTYQPLRTIFAYHGHLDLEVNDWAPATPKNIAMAKDDQIPSGYTKVTKAS